LVVKDVKSGISEVCIRIWQSRFDNQCLKIWDLSHKIWWDLPTTGTDRRGLKELS